MTHLIYEGVEKWRKNSDLSLKTVNVGLSWWLIQGDHLEYAGDLFAAKNLGGEVISLFFASECEIIAKDEITLIEGMGTYGEADLKYSLSKSCNLD